MGRFLLGRVSIGVLCAFAVPLLLAAIQYRWSEELVASDLKLTRAHLDAAARSFSDEFDHTLADLYLYVQTSAADSLERGVAPANPPRLLGGLYDISRQENRYSLRRIELDGSTHEIEGRDKAGQLLLTRYGPNSSGGCWSHLWSDIPAFVAPVSARPTGGQPNEPNHCLAATVDSAGVKAVFSELLEREFGADASKTWTFAVVETSSMAGIGSRAAVYGTELTRADLAQSFFGFPMDARVNEHMRKSLSPQHPFLGWMGPHNTGLPPSGMWTLQAKHKSGSLENSAAVWRRLTLLVSGLLEILLMATTLAVIASTQRIRKLGEQRVQFAAGVSHELRTPVAAIGLLSRNMASGLVVRPEAVKKYGAMIYEQTERLGRMVEQTLQFAGIDSRDAKPNLKELRIESLIDDVVQRNREKLTQAGFELAVQVAEDLPMVMADALWVERAVENLLDNAEKYTGDQRWIGIRAGFCAERQEVLITVQDRGIGIDPADFERIFHPFSRGCRAVASQIPGSGVGLALVLRTVEAHRGRVTFESEPDHGSSFTLHFPTVSTAVSR